MIVGVYVLSGGRKHFAPARRQRLHFNQRTWLPLEFCDLEDLKAHSVDDEMVA